MLYGIYYVDPLDLAGLRCPWKLGCMPSQCPDLAKKVRHATQYFKFLCSAQSAWPPYFKFLCSAQSAWPP